MSLSGLVAAGPTTGLATVIAVVLVAVVVTALVIAVRTVRNTRRAADDRMSTLVSELDRRTHELRRELGDVLASEREANRLARTFGALSASIDLAEVLRRTAEVAVELTGVDAAHIAVVTPGGEPHACTVGLSDAEAGDVELVPPISGRRVRTMTVLYEPGDEGDTAAVAGGLAVPLRSGETTLGLLTLFTRARGEAFHPGTVASAEDLAARAAPAIANACQHLEAKRLADVDRLTGLHNDRYFEETLRREVARAQRYGRPLTLLLFDVDDFREINNRFGHPAGDAVLKQLGQRVGSVVRSSDIACRVYRGDEFGVIMSESGVEDAERLRERLRNRIEEEPIQHAERIQISFGIAGLRPEDDPASLYARADAALYRSKLSR